MDQTNGYAVDTIENEGVGYAVMHYTRGPFKDAETQKLWDQAERALTTLCQHLADETGREVEACTPYRNAG